MYTLYWSEGTASLAPHIVLEELALPYQLKEIDISAGDHQTAEGP